MLNRVRQPFNVNSIAQAAAIAALADVGYVEASRELNRAGLSQLAEGFERAGVGYLPSHANFVLVHVGDAAAVNAFLMQRGVIVRPVANYGLPEWLRVTVGLPAENDRFLEVLDAALQATR
jgi:histidinol-phosphate aminotransferase